MTNYAVIEGDHIVIRIPLAELGGIVQNAGDSCGVSLSLLDDSDTTFPGLLVEEINSMAEDGGTLVDRMLDAAVWAVVDGEYDGIAENHPADVVYEPYPGAFDDPA